MSTSRIRSLVALSILAFAACSNDDNKESAASCLPGETRACFGAGQCLGVQHCAADGRSLTTCDCNVPSTSQAGAASTTLEGRGGNGGTSGAGGQVSLLGGASSLAGTASGFGGVNANGAAGHGGALVDSTTIGTSGGGGAAVSTGGSSGAAVSTGGSTGTTGGPTGGVISVATGGNPSIAGATSTGGTGAGVTGAGGVSVAVAGASMGGASAYSSAGTSSNGGGATAGAPSSTTVRIVSGTKGSHLQHVWSYGFGPYSDATQVVVGPGGSVHVLGSAPRDVDFGDGTSNDSMVDGVLFKREANGRHAWTKRLYRTWEYANLSVDGLGRLLVHLPYGYTTVDSKALCSDKLPSLTINSTYLAGLTAEGTCDWAQSFGTLSASMTHAGDAVLVTSSSTQLVDWNHRAGSWSYATGAAVAAATPNDDIVMLRESDKLYVTKLRGSTGNLLWETSTAANRPGYQTIGNSPRLGPKFHADGSVVWIGAAPAGAQLWDISIAGDAPQWTPYVVSLSANGAFAWGVTALNSELGVAPAPNGDTAICGTFKDVVTFMGQELRVPGESLTSDVYLALLGPGGRLKWIEQWRLDDYQSCGDLAFDENGDLLIAGQYSGAIDFGGGALPSGKAMMFLAKLRLGGG